MKYGLVLEGDSRKGLYTAGILDVFMEQGIHFDYIIGVSAGSHAALNYVTGQKGQGRSQELRSQRFQQLPLQRSFRASVWSVLQTGFLKKCIL